MAGSIAFLTQEPPLLPLPDLSSLPMVPDWLFDLAEAPRAANNNIEALPPTLASDRRQRAPEGRRKAYGRTVLERECAALAAVTRGSRNNELNEAAGTCAMLFACGAIDELEARNRLFAAAEANGLVARKGAPATLKTIASGFKWGLQHPRDVPGDADPIPDRDLVQAEDGSLVDDETGEIVVPAAPVEAISAAAELPDALTHVPGLLGELVDWIEASSRRPNRTSAIGAAITTLGTALGRRVAGPTLSSTVLYVIHAGPSGCGKDHSLKAGPKILKASGLGQLVGPDEFISFPAIVGLMQRKPLALCAMDEFGAFLKRILSAKASGFEGGISKVLRALWGNHFNSYNTPEYANRSSIELVAPSLNIFGVTTPGEFFDALKAEDVSNGFLNRFLYLPTEGASEDREPLADPYCFSSGLAGKLTTLHRDVNSGPSIEAGGMFRVGWKDEAAKQALQELEAKVAALAAVPTSKLFYARTVEMALRLATIRAVGCNESVVSEEDVRWAGDLALWSAERMVEAAADNMAETPFADLQNRITRIMKAERTAGRATVTGRFLLQRTKLKKRDLEEVMSTMVEAGEVVAIGREKPKVGRPPSTPFYTLAA